MKLDLKLSGKQILTGRKEKSAFRLFVSSIIHGDYIMVKGETSIEISASSIYGGQIEIRVDEINGALITTVEVNTSRKAWIWKALNALVKSFKGVHDLCFFIKRRIGFA